MEDHRRKQERDAPGLHYMTRMPVNNIDNTDGGKKTILCASVYCPGQTTSLSRQMKSGIEFKQMSKGISCDTSNSSLSDAGKYGVSELGEERCRSSCQTVFKNCFEKKYQDKIGSDDDG